MRGTATTIDPGPARRTVAAALSMTGAVVWTHALAAVLRPWAQPDAPLIAVELTLGALAVTGVGALFATPSRRSWIASGLTAIAAFGATTITRPEAWIPALAILPAGLGFHAIGRSVARRLPGSIDRLAARRRGLAWAWLALALLAVVQTGRLATFITDRDSDWFLTTREPFFAKHECANAYFYAAELDRRGEANVYDAAHYPGLTRDAEVHTELSGLSPEDPYQYAPQFLLWPRLAIALTHDFATVRAVWFAVNVTLCLGAVLALAGFVGGRAGVAAGLLAPGVLASFPALHDFQYGQFHFAAIALAVLAMIAFHRSRSAAGGMLLAVSILSKLFPALLLIPLIVRRRWRDLGWTAAAGLLLTVTSLAVVGRAPFVAFVEYQLPRLADGRAFAFEQAWPEIEGLVIAGNQGVQGIVRKLEVMGLLGIDGEAGAWAARAFGLAVLALAIGFGRRVGSDSRAELAAGWVALLGLGSLASAGAWIDYVPVTAVWLTALLVPMLAGRPAKLVVLAATLPFTFALLGGVPYGSWADPRWLVPLSLVGALVLLATFVGGLAVALRPAPAIALGRGRAEPVPVPVRIDR